MPHKCSFLPYIRCCIRFLLFAVVYNNNGVILGEKIYNIKRQEGMRRCVHMVKFLVYKINKEKPQKFKQIIL